MLKMDVEGTHISTLTRGVATHHMHYFRNKPHWGEMAKTSLWRPCGLFIFYLVIPHKVSCSFAAEAFAKEGIP